MSKTWFAMAVLMMAMVLALGAGAAWAGQFPALDAKIKAAKAKEVAAGKVATQARADGAKARAESAAYGAKEKSAAAGAAAAKAAKDAAMATQDQVCTVVGLVPVIGSFMRYYNEGEVQASLASKGNESYYGIVHAFFKGLASGPEMWATDLAWRLTGANWRELDPASVFFVNDRPYLLDAVVIGTKIFFGLAAYGVIDAGLPVLGHAAHAPMIQTAYWVALGGGSLNLLTGAGYQAAKGMSPYKAYYKNLEWRTGKPAAMPALL
jgi:hypothetical protein